MSAGFGTRGGTQVISKVSGPTSPKPRLVGAGTAIRRREQRGSCNTSTGLLLVIKRCKE